MNAIVGTFGAGTDVDFAVFLLHTGGVTHKKGTVLHTILVCTGSTAKSQFYFGLRTVPPGTHVVVKSTLES